MMQKIVDEQLHFWVNRQNNKSDIQNAYDSWNAKLGNIFIFQFTGSKVSIKEKNGFYSSESLKKRDPKSPLMVIRALNYQRFFEMVIRLNNLELNFEMAICLTDELFDSNTIPIFGFQKKEFSPAILLPDTDIIGQDLNHWPDDKIQYNDKLTKAVFVGSTTGSKHTAESVKALSDERLRNGIFFKDHPLVHFSLPNIVQCTNEAKLLISNLGLDKGRASWEEQFNHKFIISMDGNGATCSRIFLTLKSNCVLMKYASSHRLFYFSKLQEYKHYLPIYEPNDVLYFIQHERDFRGSYQQIIQNSQQFYKQYLSTKSIMRYTSELLLGCNQIFRGDTR